MYTKTLNNSQQNYSYTITNNVINLGYVDFANLVYIRFELVGITPAVDMLFMASGAGHITLFKNYESCVVSGVHYDKNYKITDNSNHNVNRVNDLCILNFHYK